MKRIPARYRPVLLAALILAAGCALRLSFGGDIEFKADEAYNFRAGQQVGTTTPWVWVGMGSSAGIVNPGMSVWIFVFLTKLFAVHTPVELGHAVALCNCLALALLLGFALTFDSVRERTIWLWGAAIAAVNPISIVLQRKLWAQSVLPLFSVLFLICWRRRDRRFPALLWGLIGALLGQIHMGGFFFAAAVALWTRLTDRGRKADWRAWFVGSFVGALPLVPWVLATTRSLARDPSYFRWIRLVMFRFWNFWAVGAFGTNISYTLGDGLRDFFRYPLVGSYPTYLDAVAEGALCVCILAFAVASFIYWRREGWNLRRFCFGDGSETDSLVSAAFVGMGILITLAAVSFQNHYLLVTFPLQFVWIARGALRFGKRGKAALLALTIAQAVISSSFLFFIHGNGGETRGDYGVAYSRQKH